MNYSNNKSRPIVFKIRFEFAHSVQKTLFSRAANATGVKGQWARAAPALHTHHFCAAHAPLTLAV